MYSCFLSCLIVLSSVFFGMVQLWVLSSLFALSAWVLVDRVFAWM